MLILKSIVVYFGVVFAAGFALGSVRIPFLVPAIGERWAELVEAPLLLIAILLTGRWMAERFTGSGRQLLLVGGGAAALVLTADVLVGVHLRGMTVLQSLFGRDPLSGAVYYILLGLFAGMPAAFRMRAGMALPGRMEVFRIAFAQARAPAAGPASAPARSASSSPRRSRA
jgi:hypothetical protein